MNTVILIFEVNWNSKRSLKGSAHYHPVANVRHISLGLVILASVPMFAEYAFIASVFIAGSGFSPLLHLPFITLHTLSFVAQMACATNLRTPGQSKLNL